MTRCLTPLYSCTRKFCNMDNLLSMQVTEVAKPVGDLENLTFHTHILGKLSIMNMRWASHMILETRVQTVNGCK